MWHLTCAFHFKRRIVPSSPVGPAGNERGEPVNIERSAFVATERGPIIVIHAKPQPSWADKLTGLVAAVTCGVAQAAMQSL